MDDILVILWIVTLISAIFGRVTIEPRSRTKTSSSSNLAPGDIMQYSILYSKVLSTTFTGTSSTSSHPAPGSTLSALQQELKPEVESPERESARYHPNFRSTRRRRRRRASRWHSGHAPRWLNVVRGGHRCPPPPSRALMPIEARARLDGQGGFRAETRKGRALKELDTMRVVLEALGSVTLWSLAEPNPRKQYRRHPGRSSRLSSTRTLRVRTLLVKRKDHVERQNFAIPCCGRNGNSRIAIWIYRQTKTREMERRGPSLIFSFSFSLFLVLRRVVVPRTVHDIRETGKLK